MPDKYNFNIFDSDGFRPTVRCIEINCNSGGALWEWDVEKRKEHFFTHQGVIISNIKENLNNNLEIISSLRKKITICRICNSEFEQERKRGRPRVFCFVCKPKGE